MAKKTYLDLKSEVWDAGTCSGCGACVAVCPADALSFSEGTSGISPVSTGYCKQETDSVPCGACYAVCPRTSPKPADTIGQYLDLSSASAAFDIPHKQSGGAVTAILASALDEGLIDCVVSVTMDRFTLKPSSVIITDSETLVMQAGSRYSWWVPLLAALKEAVIVRKYKKIAVTGLPCAVQALARIRTGDNDLLVPYAGAIRLIIGLFCTESFDYSLLTEKLRRDYATEPHEIRKMDVKGKLVITRHDGSTTNLPLRELESCIRPGCHHCTDLTALFADISAGSVGSPKGSTTLIVRTPTGRAFVDAAVRSGKLVLSPGVDTVAIEKLATEKIEKNRS
ncbi:MAG TPA: 4Fe-4S binding protein [Methanoregula sp.]|nr:4Fe-4S binding protein [Methanoregula sp.]